MNRKTRTRTYRKGRRKWNVPLIALLLIVVAGAVAVPVALLRQGTAKKSAAVKTAAVSKPQVAQPSKPAQGSKAGGPG